MNVFSEGWYGAALAIAMRLHKGQVDKAGRPYWLHLQSTSHKLVERWPDATRDQVEAALLHDVLEDTKKQPHHLRAEGVRPRVVQIVQALTRDPALPYLDWIRALAAAGDVDMLRVKLADNADNSDPCRAAAPGQEERERTRYAPARAILEAALAAQVSN